MGTMPASIRTIVVSFVGLDDTFAQTVYAQHAYRNEDVRIGYRYRDMLHPQPDGSIVIDHRRLHDIEGPVE